MVTFVVDNSVDQGRSLKLIMILMKFFCNPPHFVFFTSLRYTPYFLCTTLRHFVFFTSHLPHFIIHHMYHLTINATWSTVWASKC